MDAVVMRTRVWGDFGQGYILGNGDSNNWIEGKDNLMLL